MARTLAVLVIVCTVLAGCDSSSSGDARTSTSRQQTVPTFAVLLDDTGLHVPGGHHPAGRYLVSFDDRRTQRVPMQQVALGFRPSGPIITLSSVPAGSHKEQVLLANEVAFVTIDGERQPASEVPLPVETSRAYPTPAT